MKMLKRKVKRTSKPRKPSRVFKVRSARSYAGELGITYKSAYRKLWG